MKRKFISLVLITCFCAIPALATPEPPPSQESVSTEPSSQSSHENYWNEMEQKEEATLKKAPDVRSLFYKTVFLLVSVVGVLLGASYFVKRMTGAKLTGMSSEGAIRLLERKYLSPKCSVWLVEIEGQKAVVAENQGGVTIQLLNPKENQP